MYRRLSEQRHPVRGSVPSRPQTDDEYTGRDRDIVLVPAVPHTLMGTCGESLVDEGPDPLPHEIENCEIGTPRLGEREGDRRRSVSGQEDPRLEVQAQDSVSSSPRSSSGLHTAAH